MYAIFNIQQYGNIIYFLLILLVVLKYIYYWHCKIDSNQLLQEFVFKMLTNNKVNLKWKCKNRMLCTNLNVP